MWAEPSSHVQKVFNNDGQLILGDLLWVGSDRVQFWSQSNKLVQTRTLNRRSLVQVEDPSTANDEGITALHNAVCAGHTEIVKFLVQFGVNANAADSDGW